MIEKETQHFLRCIRPLSVRIGSGRATSGPSMAGAVDIPVLQDLAFAVGVGRAGIPMPSRNLPAPKANLVLREYLTQAVDGHRESHSDLPVLRVVARHDSQCALTIARMSDENLKFWNEVRE